MSNDLTRTTMGEVTEMITSGSRGWARYYADDGSLFLRMTNLPRQGTRLLLDDLMWVRVPQGLGEAQRTRVRQGDVLISITAELGKIGLVDDRVDEAFVNQHVALVRPNPRLVDPGFLANYLAAPPQRPRFERLNDAGAKAGLNLASLDRFPVTIPGLPEQLRISSLLATWDTAIERTRRLIQAKLRYRAALAALLADSSVSSNGRAGASRRMSLGDGVHVDARQVDPRLEPYRSMLHLGPEDVTAGTGQLRVLKTAGELGLVSRKCLFDERSVVYSRIRPYLNKVCLPGFSGLCSSEMYPLGVDETVAVAEYLLAAMLSPKFLRSAVLRTTGTGLPRARWNDLKSIDLVLPPLDRQRQAADVFGLINQEVHLLQRCQEGYEAQKAGFAAKLLASSGGSS